jgi:hypothetical protein
MKLQLVSLAMAFLSVSSVASAKNYTIKTQGTDPGCYQLPNVGVHSAIIQAEEKAKAICDRPRLVDINIKIYGGGCSASVALATYICSDSTPDEE